LIGWISAKKGLRQKPQSIRSGILFKKGLLALAELLHQQLSNHPQLYVTEAIEAIWFRVKKSLRFGVGRDSLHK
jgi:hypothetical protein